VIPNVPRARYSFLMARPKSWLFENIDPFKTFHTRPNYSFISEYEKRGPHRKENWWKCCKSVPEKQSTINNAESSLEEFQIDYNNKTRTRT